MIELNRTTGLMGMVVCGLVLLACDLTISTQTNPPPASSSAQPPPPGQPAPGEPPIGQPPPPPGQPPPSAQPGEPQITFSADRTNLNAGECATISWNAQGSVFAADLNGQKVNLTGQQQVCPKESTMFALNVDAGKSVIRREIAINVQVAGGQPPPPPASSSSSTSASAGSSSIPAGCAGAPVFASAFTANPSTIVVGQSTTLSWGNVTNGNTGPLVGSLKLEPGFGEVGSGASQRVAKPNQTTTYTLTATGCGGTATRQVTVIVSSPVITPIPGFVVPTATLQQMQVMTFDLAIDEIYPEPTGKISMRLKNLGNADVTNANVPLNCSAKVTYVANPNSQATMAMPPRNISVTLKSGQTSIFDTGFGRDPSIQSMWVTCTISLSLMGDNSSNNSLTKQVK